MATRVLLGASPAFHSDGQNSEVARERRRPNTNPFYHDHPASLPFPGLELDGGFQSNPWVGDDGTRRKGPRLGEAGKSLPGPVGCACLRIMTSTESQGRIMDQV